MTKISGLPKRLGALILALGFPFFAGARTQSEQPDAGDDMAFAEIVDCKVDRINGSVDSPDDADLYWFFIEHYGHDGAEQIDCVSTTDTALMLFDSLGRCVAIADAVSGGGTESVRVNLAAGHYYLFVGPPGTTAYHNQADYDGEVNGYRDPRSGLGSAGPLFKVKSAGGQTGSYEIRFNFKHDGIGVEPDMACGLMRDPDTQQGWGTLRDHSAPVRVRGRKVKLYYSCKNVHPNRGCLSFLEGSNTREKLHRRKFFLLGAARVNVTASVSRGNLFLDFEPDEVRTFECRIRPRGKERRKRVSRFSVWMFVTGSKANSLFSDVEEHCSFRGKFVK